ncbi:MAG: hypothetical protein WBF99_17625 [Xanthobacteraceae bacterium]
MRHIDLSPSENDSQSKSGLYLTEPTSHRLLLVVQASTQDSTDAAMFAETLTADGWSVLHIAAANSAADADAAATMIFDTLKHAMTEMKIASAAALKIVAIADGAAALPTCMTVLQSHRHATLSAIDGIVTIDGFGQTAAKSTAPRMSDIAAELTRLDGLSTIVAAHRLSTEARHAGMSHHRQLQALSKETHYLVLSESKTALLTQLADAHNALGREVRWLLDPVHSRNDT